MPLYQLYIKVSYLLKKNDLTNLCKNVFYAFFFCMTENIIEIVSNETMIPKDT